MRFLPAILISLTLAAPCHAQQSPRSRQLDELKQLTIEELVGTDVTTASRRLERLADVAAAVTVISGEDLRRLGVYTLAQALRLAGHLDVAQVTGPQYAIAARGFNISTANKMLVMIDGRTVYSPVFAGVFWEAQDILIGDIDRIEVVRGPGGTLWGANAVNGVIHVITKNAADTRGTFINAAAGSDALGPFAIRHGGRFGAAGSYRVYAKVRSDDGALLQAGGDAGNQHDFGQAGFRVESDRTGNNFAILQGDVFSGNTGLGVDGDRSIALRGGNLLGRWIHRADTGSETTLQAYYDFFYRRVPAQYRGELHTIDVDAQHQRSFGRHVVVVGGGYRHYRGDDLGDGPGFFFEPQVRVSHRSNAFAQAQFTLRSNLFLTAGTKLEHNEFTGVEAQPMVSARWTPGTRTLWGSVSRAVRVPTRFDTDLRFRVPNSSLLALTGTEDFRSESLIAYEAGYRRRYGDRFSIDVAAFENRYDDLRSQELSPVPPGIPIRLMNMLNAVTRGVEISSRTQVTPWWQLGGGYTHLWKRLTFDPGSLDRTGGRDEANDPRHIVKLRSYIDAGRLEFDGFFRYISALPNPEVDAYTELDARVGYRVRPGWDLSLVGTNLLHKSHLEFRGGTPPQLYRRGVAVRSTWRF
jgi:iron complex outermembrane receptor protein